MAQPRIDAARAALPFRLTPAQARAWTEIRADLGRPHPMSRLLQGDVGSGKTAVAFLATIAAAESGFQSALMAPTELLAEQHAGNFRHWLEPLGVDVAWVGGKMAAADRRASLDALAGGDASNDCAA